jgi:carbon monoxide dehydrogenase subunit G
MIISNEFTVGADLETVWRHLLDMQRVAGCLPGASVTETREDNVFDGTMRLKVGPMTVEYRGRATLKDIDEQTHTAVIELSAREAKGQGTAMATIFNRVEPRDGGTRVRAETDLHITGPQAQFGHGVIEDVGGRVMSEFSRRLERQIEQDQQPEAGGPDRSATARTPQMSGDTAPSSDVLEVGAFLPARVKFVAGLVAGLVLALALLRARRR